MYILGKDLGQRSPGTSAKGMERRFLVAYLQQCPRRNRTSCQQ